jgi:hypothetical protein
MDPLSVIKIFGKGVDVASKGVDIAKKMSTIEDKIAKYAYSDDKRKFFVAKILCHQMGISLEDFLQEIEKSFTTVATIDYYGRQQKINSYNVYGQAYQHMIKCDYNIDNIIEIDDEWFFEWEKIASNTVNQNKQGIIGKIGVEKLFNNAKISASTLRLLDQINNDVFDFIIKIAPFVGFNKDGIGIIFGTETDFFKKNDIDFDNHILNEIPFFKSPKNMSLSSNMNIKYPFGELSIVGKECDWSVEVKGVYVSWNNKPITVGHPYYYGIDISYGETGRFIAEIAPLLYDTTQTPSIYTKLILSNLTGNYKFNDFNSPT